MNIAQKNVTRLLQSLPALRNPTISQLGQKGWVAVETIIDKHIVRELIPALKAAGADTLCMCCNTAHYALDHIAEQSGARFINLIEEVALAARQTGKKRLGLVSSDGCLASGIYQRHFAARYPEAKLILPSAVMQAQVTRGICNIKRTTRFMNADNPDSPHFIFSQVAESLRHDGAELIILGCTDIRVAFTCADGLDSLEVLAAAIEREARKG